MILYFLNAIFFFLFSWTEKSKAKKEPISHYTSLIWRLIFFLGGRRAQKVQDRPPQIVLRRHFFVCTLLSIVIATIFALPMLYCFV